MAKNQFQLRRSAGDFAGEIVRSAVCGTETVDMSFPIAVRIRKRWPAPVIPTFFSVPCPCLVLRVHSLFS